MPIRLDEDERAVTAAEALLVGLAKFNVTREQISKSDVPEPVEKLFNTLVRTAYQNRELTESVEGFTFWSLLDWVFTHNYEKWITKPDRKLAIEFLQIISANLRRETKPKLLFVPVRRTRIEAPMQLDSFYIIPPQETEERFVATLKELGFKTAKIRECLFDHMKVTTGHNFTHRPSVVMPTAAFIASMIALESLFSRDPKTPLRATLADSVALLTESKIEARIAASRRSCTILEAR